MNALLDIQIRVQAQQALSQLRAVQGQINSLNGTTTGTTAASVGALGKLGGAIDAVSTKMISWGKNMQWTGQQLTMSFTLPLALLGGMATKWALENEAAFTRVKKVYSGANEDLDKLRTSFELLSSRFGVNQKEVIGIGEAWAAVGARGVQLAKSVEQTMKFMILSGLDADKATEGLIVTQTAYKLSTEELTQAIADMNAIENVTALRMADLLEGLQKAGGAAELTGIDIRHLSAYMAALVPVTGGAAQAGTALKTIFSRIFAPTPEAEEMLRIIGITNTELGKQAWHAANGEKRIEMLADASAHLTDEQQAVMASVLGSRRQYNQLITLLDQVRDANGQYQIALDATSDSEKSQAAAAKELTTFLSSSPQGFKIMTTTLQNMLAKAIVPLLPALAGFLSKIVQMVKWFTDLSPETQQFIMTMLTLLALLGPVVRYVGAFSQLLGVLGKAFGHALTGAIWFFKTVVWGFGELVAKSAWATAKFVADTAVRAGASLAWIAKEAAGAAFWALQWIGALAARGLAWAADVARRTATEIAWLAGDLARAAAWVGEWLFMLAVRASTWLADVAARTAMEVAWFVEDTARAAAWVAAWITAGAARVSALIAQGVLWLSVQASQVAIQVATWVAGQAAMAAASVAAAAASAAAWIAANPYLALLVVAIGAVLVALAAVVFFWDTDFMQAIRSGVGNVLNWFSKIPEFLGGLVEWFENAFAAIINGFNALPRNFAQMLQALLQLAAKFITKIVDWLSYLNPFQRHSPSLVDNVTAGVAEILRQYSKLGRIGSILSGVQSAHESFQRAATPTLGDATSRQFESQRKAVAERSPNVLPAFDAHVALITKLKAELPAIEALIARQKVVVQAWADALDAANEKLAAAEKLLKQYKDELQAIEDQISQTKSAISALADTGIVGMRAMEDAIFENEMAQKKLRLELLRIGKAYGGIDKLKDKFAQLAGEIEKLRSEREDLRQAGADASILAQYDEQIKSLQKQQDEIQEAGDQISKLEAELEKLKQEAEELDLEKSITFDPQLRQIDQLVKGLNELPFDQIISKIKEQQAHLADLEKQQAAVNQKVVDQTAVVKQLTDERDRIQEQYDAEKKTLDQIQAVYDAIDDAIKLLESDLQNFNSALDSTNEKVSDLQRMMDEATGQFDELAQIDPEEMGNLDDFNAELQRQLDDALAAMDQFDMWKPLKDKWEEFKQWWDPKWQAFQDGITTVWPTVMNLLKIGIDGFVFAFGGAIGRMYVIWGGLTNFITTNWNTIIGGLQSGWNMFTSWIGGRMDWIKEHWSTILTLMGSPFQLFVGLIRIQASVIETIWSVLTSAMKGDWDGVWASAKTSFENFKRGLSIIWDGIVGIFKFGANTIAAIVETALNGLIGAMNGIASGLGGLTHQQFPQLPEVHLPRLARGGITNGPAIIGEGNKMFPEYVIPTDPAYFSNARDLFFKLGNDLGLSAGGYDVPTAAVAGGGDTNLTFSGDLVFPNVNNGNDAKEFLENLKSLGKD